MKKMNRQKPIEEINSKQLIENSNLSPMDTTTHNHKMFKISNENIKKEQNQRTAFLELMKLRKEYELKVEQENSRKKVMNDLFEKRNGTLKRKLDQNCSHQQTFKYPNVDNSSVNYNNGIGNPTRWDCTSSATHINSMANHNVQNPYLNSMSQQALQQPSIQVSQYSNTQPQIFSNYHVDNSVCFNTLPSPQQSSTLLNSNKPVQLKTTYTNVFDLMNDTIHNYYADNKNKNINSEIELSNTLFTSAALPCADLIAKIKIITNSFRNEPPEWLKIKELKKTGNKSKLEKIPLSDQKLKSVCDKNKRTIFINEQSDITSNKLI